MRRSDVDGVTGRIDVTRKVDKDANPAVRGACRECGRSISSRAIQVWLTGDTRE